MDGKVKSMAQKRARHYPETKSVVGAAMIIGGIVAAFVLIVLWPQQFLITIFNSRLDHRLVLDDQDYYTCSRDYKDFVISEPEADFYMLSFYIFTVTNAAGVVERGFEPTVEETGPYSFTKYSYKYDIYFDPEDSLTVTFKEYSYLTELTDPDQCEAMFYRMERDYLLTDPCADDACKCKSSLNTVTVINPLFLKILWKDTSFELLAHYSVEAFTNIKAILDEPFTEAIKSSLVTNAYKEIYLFRLYMQSMKMIQTSVDNLVNVQGYTLKQITTQNLVFPTCGLNIYLMNYCPFSPFSIYIQQQVNSTVTYPAITNFFNSSYSYSLFLEENYAKWISISYLYGYIGFNALKGFTMVNAAEINSFIDSISLEFGQSVFGVSTFSRSQKIALAAVIRSIAKFIGNQYIAPSSVSLSSQTTRAMTTLAATEFQSTSEPVICEPSGSLCVWQFGYMNKYEGSGKKLNSALTSTLIDIGKVLSSNPNSIYKDSNAEHFYNAHLYCTRVLPANSSFKLGCTDLAETFEDALLDKPAGYWAAERGLSTVNMTNVVNRYRKYNSTYRETYFYLSCNISALLQDVYRTKTNFHDNYVVRYLNKFQDPDLNYNFTVGNWSDLGIAQWAGGFVTQAVMNVRTLSQIYRDGMWRIGDRKYYEYLMEYSSWAVIQGYPQAWIYSLSDARLLLDTLARTDQVGVNFRRHIMYTGSTFIGDGSRFVQGVGAVGDITFMREVNFADFTCPGQPTEAQCLLLNQTYTSSAEECQVIADLYKQCTREQLFNDNLWVNDTSCTSFETTSTAPTTGIQCNAGFIYGNPHPYTKSMGNIIYTMMYAFTLYTTLSVQLWCESVPTCEYNYGGMFTTTTARKLLFEGYTEPSILKYYDLKFSLEYDISFECVTDAYDTCGVKNFRCDDSGIKIKFPIYNSTTKNTIDYVLNYGDTTMDEYFAPDIIYNRVTNELLWPYSMNSSAASYASEQLAIYSNATDSVENKPILVTILNPFWQAYANWHSNDTDFLKYYQCQHRYLNGRPNNWNSCDNVIYTGRDYVNKSMSLKVFHGNESIYQYRDTTQSILVNGSLFNEQHPMYRWAGFFSYPYTYNGLSQGVDFYTYTEPMLFNDLTYMHYSLSQRTLTYSFDRVIPVKVPYSSGTILQPDSFKVPITVRRFIEDADTWQPYRTMGVSVDSYGEPFKVPIGMATLERFADFPIFVETPHSYGNFLWGGTEYTFVTGTSQNQYAYRTFVDYDPITGKAIRTGKRQQLTLRVEASSMFPSAFSSQQRCLVPTKSYALSSGYGCFAYIPLLWHEEAIIRSSKSIYQTYDHYYTRPDRANLLTIAGIVLGAFFIIFGSCVCVNEAYHKRRFYSRVYVD